MHKLRGGDCDMATEGTFYEDDEPIHILIGRTLRAPDGYTGPATTVSFPFSAHTAGAFGAYWACSETTFTPASSTTELNESETSLGVAPAGKRATATILA
jgi:hypothetical protein